MVVFIENWKSLLIRGSCRKDLRHCPRKEED